MIPILTYTANLVAETTYYTDDWKLGTTRRATRESFQVGGKGINVCKMLLRLGAESEALCFPGGAFGPSCEKWLSSRDIPYRAFRENCVTRSGSVIHSPGQAETTILGVDSQVSKVAVTQSVDFLKAQSGPYRLAMCGVFQDWNNENWDPLRDWLQRRPSNVRLAIDTYGPSLPWFASETSPELIKINRQELETLFDEEMRTHPTDTLLEQTAERFDCPLWIVTDGETAIHFKESGQAPKSLQPRRVEAVSATGCGDVFLATLLHAQSYRPELDLMASIALAAEYATRNAASHEIATFPIDGS